MPLPPSPGGEGKSKKKINPLTDLIETEKVYVDLLTGIMRVSNTQRRLATYFNGRIILTESCICVVATELATAGAGQNVSEY